jgi:hypothetical protein
MNEQYRVRQRLPVRLDLYEEAIMLTSFQEQGAAAYLVSIYDLAAARTGVSVSRVCYQRWPSSAGGVRANSTWM